MAASGVASAIFEFLADPVRTSLELPHMTTGQRKSIKKLVQQQPDLSCESYGFGAERQLYLFKPSAASCNKNDLERSRSASPDDSTAAPSDASSDSGNPPSHRELPEHVIQVHNTFIHYEEVPDEERAVKSMPHNMFRQCIMAESRQRAGVQETPTFASPPTPLAELESTMQTFAAEAQYERLSPGALVVVEGLLKLPAFNGCSAIVQSWDEAVGRYDILIASSVAPGGYQQAKIKEENLRLVLPCP